MNARKLLFHLGRRIHWRADLGRVKGGFPGGGRHNRGGGYAKDAEKYLEAVLAGWTVIRLTEKQLEIGSIERIVAMVIKKTLN